MTPERNVALLANFRTRNLGNHALTRVMQSLVVRAYGDERTLRLHRMPHPVTEVVTTAPPERWAARTQAILRLDPATADPAALARHRTIDLPAAGAESLEKGALRQAATTLAHTPPGLRLRALRAKAAGRQHLTGLLAADDIFWVPGGEIPDRGIPMGRMLDITLARAARKRVTIADLSFEPSPEARPHFERLAPGFDWAVPRDHRSAEVFVDIGVPEERVRVVPDVVFLLGSDVLPEVEVRPAVATRPRLAVVLHGWTDLDWAAWRSAMSLAADRGYEIEILSSHLEQDTRAIKVLLDGDVGASVTIAPEFTDLQAYVRHLSGFTSILTGRFHSAVMGIVAGLTVAAVDTYGTKVATGLRTAGFDDAVMTPDGVGSSSWVDRFEHRLDTGVPVPPGQLAELRRRILDGYAEVLSPPHL